MIIFGWRAVTYTKERGSFFCPECTEQQDYKRKRIRRFFQLYLLPLVPLDLISEYVECRECKTTFTNEVLTHDFEGEAAEAKAEFHRSLKLAMVHMMLTNGQIEDIEILAYRRVYEEITGTTISKQDAQQEIRSIDRSQHSVVEDLAQSHWVLNDDGKEVVLRAAITVAISDRVVTHKQMFLIHKIAEILHMAPVHLRRVLADSLDQAPFVPVPFTEGSG